MKECFSSKHCWELFAYWLQWLCNTCMVTNKSSRHHMASWGLVANGIVIDMIFLWINKVGRLGWFDFFDHILYLVRWNLSPENGVCWNPLAMWRLASTHHLSRFKKGLSDVNHRWWNILFVKLSIRAMTELHEMNPWERNQSCAHLSIICNRLARVSHATCHVIHGCSDHIVDVIIQWRLNLLFSGT